MERVCLIWLEPLSTLIDWLTMTILGSGVILFNHEKNESKDADSSEMFSD
jgi:hypothetical protein